MRLWAAMQVYMIERPVAEKAHDATFDSSLCMHHRKSKTVRQGQTPDAGLNTSPWTKYSWNHQKNTKKYKGTTSHVSSILIGCTQYYFRRKKHCET